MLASPQVPQLFEYTDGSESTSYPGNPGVKLHCKSVVTVLTSFPERTRTIDKIVSRLIVVDCVLFRIYTVKYCSTIPYPLSTSKLHREDHQNMRENMNKG